MDSSNAPDDPFEKSWDKVVYLIYLADLKDFLKLGQEQSLLDTVCKGPILEQPLKERDSQSSVLGQK